MLKCRVCEHEQESGPSATTAGSRPEERLEPARGLHRDTHRPAPVLAAVVRPADRRGVLRDVRVRVRPAGLAPHRP